MFDNSADEVTAIPKFWYGENPTQGAAGTASGAMGFLQQGIGSLISQFGAYLGGHSTTTLPLTSALFAISIACACTMIFVVPRRNVVVSEGVTTALITCATGKDLQQCFIAWNYCSNVYWHSG